MFVSVWQGAVVIKTYSGKCTVTIGPEKKTRYVFVDQSGSCTTLRTDPEGLRSGKDILSADGAGKVMTPGDSEPMIEDNQRLDGQGNRRP
jgi:hypothetical protein